MYTYSNKDSALQSSAHPTIVVVDPDHRILAYELRTRQGIYNNRFKVSHPPAMVNFRWYLHLDASPQSTAREIVLVYRTKSDGVCAPDSKGEG
jgi:hypothetical protein